MWRLALCVYCVRVRPPTNSPFRSPSLPLLYSELGINFMVEQELRELCATFDFYHPVDLSRPAHCAIYGLILLQAYETPTPARVFSIALTSVPLVSRHAMKHLHVQCMPTTRLASSPWWRSIISRQWSLPVSWRFSDPRRGLRHHSRLVACRHRAACRYREGERRVHSILRRIRNSEFGWHIKPRCITSVSESKCKHATSKACQPWIAMRKVALGEERAAY